MPFPIQTYCFSVLILESATVHCCRGTSYMNINTRSWCSNTSGQVLTSMPLAQRVSNSVQSSWFASQNPSMISELNENKKGVKGYCGCSPNCNWSAWQAGPPFFICSFAQLSPPAAIVKDDTWPLDKKTSIPFIPQRRLHQTLKWTNHPTSLQTEQYKILKPWHLQLPCTGNFYASVSKHREVGQAFQVPEAIHLPTWED